MSLQGKSASPFFFSEDFDRTPGGFGLSLVPSAATPSLSADPGGVGFLHEIGGTIEGFNSCTESLGCESSDERSVDDGSQIDELEGRREEMAESATGRPLRGRSAEKRRVEFPPPLTSMNKYGQRNFVLRPVRRDGRLELTEVRIRRPELLFASRENGRLTLRFVGDLDEEEEETEELAGDDLAVEEEQELKEGGGGSGGGGWKSPASGGEEGEALRRCHEYEAARHRHLRVLSPRCVTTR